VVQKGKVKDDKMKNKNAYNKKVYLSSRKPPKDVEILKGENGALYYIANSNRRKPSTSIGKIVLPSGKTKYLYPKGEEPQTKYYYSEKGQIYEKKRRDSLKRKEYLKDYYKKNSEKINKRNLERYHIHKKKNEQNK
jgi:hypothetical protein